MKKALTFLLLLIYSTASTGLVVNIHYCMDRFDSVQIGDSGSDVCGKCGMHQDENECCFDDVKVLKLNTSHLASDLLIPVFSLPDAVSFTTEFLLVPLVNFDKEDRSYLTHSPPLISSQDTYLQNCVFRI